MMRFAVYCSEANTGWLAYGCLAIIGCWEWVGKLSGILSRYMLPTASETIADPHN